MSSYRLVGYENRLLGARDFTDDRKDAGELGAGQSVTALYEVVPTGVEAPGVEPLRYGAHRHRRHHSESGELLYAKVRYKEPDGHRSHRRAVAFRDDGGEIESASTDLKFAAAVATFGLLLRDSEFRGYADWALALELAKRGRGEDPDGHRRELIELIELAAEISGT